jgi:hypothetical protein
VGFNNKPSKIISLKLYRVVDEELMTTALIKAKNIKLAIQKLNKAVGAESWGLSCGPQNIQEVIFDENGVAIM